MDRRHVIRTQIEAHNHVTPTMQSVRLEVIAARRMHETAMTRDRRPLHRRAHERPASTMTTMTIVAVMRRAAVGEFRSNTFFMRFSTYLLAFEWICFFFMKG